MRGQSCKDSTQAGPGLSPAFFLSVFLGRLSEGFVLGLGLGSTMPPSRKQVLICSIHINDVQRRE